MILQVSALALVGILHLIYLRICTPYRLRIELAAEMLASLCDVAVFACGIVLVTKKEWSKAEQQSMGVAMLILQAIGFLVFISVRISLALRTMLLTTGFAPRKLLFWKKQNGRERASGIPSGTTAG